MTDEEVDNEPNPEMKPRPHMTKKTTIVVTLFMIGVLAFVSLLMYVYIYEGSHQ